MKASFTEVNSLEVGSYNNELLSNLDRSQEVHVSIAYCEFLGHIEANRFAEDSKDDADDADLTYFQECVLEPPADVYISQS